MLRNHLVHVAVGLLAQALRHFLNKRGSLRGPRREYDLKAILAKRVAAKGKRGGDHRIQREPHANDNRSGPHAEPAE